MVHKKQFVGNKALCGFTITNWSSECHYMWKHVNCPDCRRAAERLRKLPPQTNNSAMLEIALCLQRVFIIVNFNSLGKYNDLETRINAVVAQLQQ
jgi:hypothetical protein